MTDEDREAQRAVILQRRARLVACAVMTGVATAQGACACLSPMPDEGAGAAASSMNACLSGAPPYNEGGAGASGTLMLGQGGESGGASTSAGGEGGVAGVSICLSLR
jgi:hypothetical protein